MPSSFLVQRGRPRRVSSIPSTCGAADSTGRRLGVRDEGRARDRPAHRQLCGHRRHRTARPDRHSSGPSGPAGDPSPGRQLRDRLGERLALAQPLPAGELPLVPAHHQRPVAVGQVLGTGGAPLPHHRGEHPALRARRRVRIGRTQVHRPGPVPVSHYPVHPNAGQAEKDRRTVLHARGSVPLPGFVVDALAQHLSEMAGRRRRAGVPGGQGRSHPAGDAQTADGFPRCDGLVCSRTRRGHLRHHYASVLLDGEESVEVVQECLGHASAEETLRTCAHVMPRSD